MLLLCISLIAKASFRSQRYQEITRMHFLTGESASLYHDTSLKIFTTDIFLQGTCVIPWQVSKNLDSMPITYVTSFSSLPINASCWSPSRASLVSSLKQSTGYHSSLAYRILLTLPRRAILTLPCCIPSTPATHPFTVQSNHQSRTPCPSSSPTPPFPRSQKSRFSPTFNNFIPCSSKTLAFLLLFRAAR